MSKFLMFLKSPVVKKYLVLGLVAGLGSLAAYQANIGAVVHDVCLSYVSGDGGESGVEVPVPVSIGAGGSDVE